MLRSLLAWLRQFLFFKNPRPMLEGYLFLRIAKAHRWRNDETGKPPKIEEVVLDIKLRNGEKGLSLYKLFNENEAEKLACIYSLALRDNPGHFEYILFPINILSGYDFSHKPVNEHPCFLSDRHYEIHNPNDEQLLELAKRILRSPEKKVGRIKKQEIIEITVKNNFIETEKLHNRVHSNWQKLIDKKTNASK